MRVTSEIWVGALTRRVFSDGGFAAVVRRGSAEAGAIFVVARDAAGQRLLGPAPQAAYDSARPQDRAFTQLKAETEAEIEARLLREHQFDSDLWIVEIEPGRTPLEDLLTITPA